MWTMLRRRNRTGSRLNKADPTRFEEHDLIEQAHREWQAARALFEQVSDPELIDQAIHRLTATEKRYVYLLKRFRLHQSGDNFSPPPA